MSTGCDTPATAWCSIRSAPSTLGTFLRAFTHGHVQQLNAVLRRSLIALAERTPLLPGAEQVVFVDLDSTHRQVYGYAYHRPKLEFVRNGTLDDKRVGDKRFAAFLRTLDAHERSDVFDQIFYTGSYYPEAIKTGYFAGHFPEVAAIYRKLQARKTSNQTLQPTPSRLVSSFHMIKIQQEIAIRALASRG